MSNGSAFGLSTPSQVSAADLMVERQEVPTSIWAGTRIIEDLAGIYDAIQSESWVDGALNGVALVADTVAAVLNPLGELIAMGAGWLIEHLWPLNEWLTELTGDSAAVTAASGTWANIAAQMQQSAEQVLNDLDAYFKWQEGLTIEAFCTAQTRNMEAMSTVSSVANGISKGLSIAAMLVQVVRELVRDALSDVVGHGVTLLLYEVFSLGLATPYVIAEVSALVTKWVTRLGSQVTGLIRSFNNLSGLMRQGGDKIDEMIDALRRLVENVSTGGLRPAFDTPNGVPVGRGFDGPYHFSKADPTVSGGRGKPSMPTKPADLSAPPRYGVRSADEGLAHGLAASSVGKHADDVPTGVRSTAGRADVVPDASSAPAKPSKISLDIPTHRVDADAPSSSLRSAGADEALDAVNAPKNAPVKAIDDADELVSHADDAPPVKSDAAKSVDEGTKSVDEAAKSGDEAAKSTDEAGAAAKNADKVDESADAAKNVDKVDEGAESVDEAAASGDEAAKSPGEATDVAKNIDEVGDAAKHGDEVAESVDKVDEAAESVDKATKSTDEASAAVKNADKADESADAAKNADKVNEVAESADKVSDAAKHTDGVSDSADELSESGDETAKSEVQSSADPQAVKPELSPHQHDVPRSVEDLARILDKELQTASEERLRELLESTEWKERLEFVRTHLLEGDIEKVFDGKSYFQWYERLSSEMKAVEKGPFRYPDQDGWGGAVENSVRDYGAVTDEINTQHVDTIGTTEMKAKIAEQLGFEPPIPDDFDLEIDRLGSKYGTYFGGVGPNGIESFSRRAVSPESLFSDYHRWKIDLDALPSDVTVRVGTVRPWFTYEGGAKQLQFFIEADKLTKADKIALRLDKKGALDGITHVPLSLERLTEKYPGLLTLVEKH